ncbi:DNA mismatch repair protein MutL [Pholiota conissans]|uniref:DNA mismatch repair protein PMS1 n=1 Tax=Pholiota conissans TaxID=109636 RepID=A0A9P5ZDC2_9AGAR|nr:DNA mismatch repair protein MutL [Pholiota conissans]
MSIKAIDKASIHHITSGQVVVDLQTSVKELIENSLDGGATNIEVRFKNNGLSSIEVIDNGCGISEEDHESIGLKHHTSKLETFSDLTTVQTFGFRGEAISSLCALCEQVTICTATATTAPMGASLVLDNSGRLKRKTAVARNQGTTITLMNIFSSLAVRRKELQRNIKREYGKTLSLLNAYALGPCATTPGIRLTVSNQPDKGPKSVQIQTLGSSSCRDSITALWGPKAFENIVDMDLSFDVEREKITIKRLQGQQLGDFPVQVKGLVSKFAVGCGRTGTDRQFFYVNGRPCNMNKVQKTFNEVYRSFNATQSPFIVANIILPTETYDVNVSPDKRTILLHSEGNLISALKLALETHFAPTRATYDLESQTQNHPKTLTQTLLSKAVKPSGKVKSPASTRDDVQDLDCSPMIDEEGPSSVDGSPRVLPVKSQARPVASPSEQEGVHSADMPIPIEVDMEGDGEDEDDNSRAPNIVLDTSQTSWGRRLSQAQPGPSPSKPIAVEEDNSTDDISTTAHPRKKRKSDSGLALIETPSSGDSNGPPSPAEGLRALRSYTAEPRVHAVSQVKVSTVSQKASQKLRDQLVGFARSGSQIASSSKSLKAAVIEIDEEEEDELEEEEYENGPEVLQQDDEEQNEDEEMSDEIQDMAPKEIDEEVPARPSTTPGAALSNDGAQESAEDDHDSQGPNTLLDDMHTESSLSTTPRTTRIEVVKGDQSVGDMSLRFDSDRIKAVWSQKLNKRSIRMRDGDGDQLTVSIPLDANVSNTDNEEGAVNALARIIEKKDFETMAVVGQFNQGFIVVRRQNTQQKHGEESEAQFSNLDDLFIVDQHAADEKYNFETLQATTKIESQKLFRPRPLELTASDELVAIENIDVLQQNGFEVEIDQEATIGQSSRLKLTAQPVSKGTVFDMKDLEEVIHLLRDRPGGQMVRCSKARAMFAMRACRKSVMIGMSLKLHQMTTVIRHMGTMDQPWNCPHGRPTMRHLLDIRSRGAQPKADIDWSSFE